MVLEWEQKVLPIISLSVQHHVHVTLCVLRLFCVGNLRIDRRIEPLLLHPLQFPRNAKTKTKRKKEKNFEIELVSSVLKFHRNCKTVPSNACR